jgi:hypothetical protein
MFGMKKTFDANFGSPAFLAIAKIGNFAPLPHDRLAFVGYSITTVIITVFLSVHVDKNRSKLRLLPANIL